ncbi:Holliday junction ATP-dependent DNA helicase RuvA [hydrothermal vent metagenome]|uniref:Holliday junction ATP-dependent DNA helicase RuvA n=1 Tax=hydrothermal vent metagenome TaxID=652676 RepID=A0A3B0T7E1_9ZZZZ
MIGRLRGVIAQKEFDTVLVEVGGVGYVVTIPPKVHGELPAVGSEAVLHIHTHVREDQLALYGFATAEQRDVFRILIAVSGIGPKVGIAILGTLDVSSLRRAVVTDDVDTLTTVPGIGKRSAQKLLIELKPKMDLPDAEVVPGTSSVLVEVRDALAGLGYQPAEIRSAVVGLPDEGTVEVLLRSALRSLGANNA